MPHQSRLVPRRRVLVDDVRLRRAVEDARRLLIASAAPSGASAMEVCAFFTAVRLRFAPPLLRRGAASFWRHRLSADFEWANESSEFAANAGHTNDMVSVDGSCPAYQAGALRIVRASAPVV